MLHPNDRRGRSPRLRQAISGRGHRNRRSSASDPLARSAESPGSLASPGACLDRDGPLFYVLDVFCEHGCHVWTCLEQYVCWDFTRFGHPVHAHAVTRRRHRRRDCAIFQNHQVGNLHYRLARTCTLHRVTRSSKYSKTVWNHQRIREGRAKLKHKIIPRTTCSGKTNCFMMCPLSCALL
jgi:hypothetical protein